VPPVRIHCTWDSTRGLRLNLFARLSPGADPIQGFEIANGKPVVAFPHRLVAVGKEEVVTVPSLDPINGIAVDGAGRLRLQYAHRIGIVGGSQIDNDATLTPDVSGRLVDSGNPLFLETRTEERSVRFIARRPDGKPLPLMTVQGQFHLASWNSLGLATVVGDDLLVWPARSKKVVCLASDIGLRSAVDACMVGPDRAVVALPHVVLLISGKTRLVLVGFSARCRWDKGVLYLLDQRHGMIWTVRGLEKLGNPENDTAYATELIKTVPKEAQEDDSRVLEAARIIGCNKARALLLSLSKPN
jgi:hypothetical protein